MPEKLDKTDIEILRLLQQNSNRTIKNIADLLGMTTTPVFDRIKKLEKRGFISKYAAILDSKETGLKTDRFRWNRTQKPYAELFGEICQND